MYDRSYMNTIPQCEIIQFYEDFRVLAEEVQNAENEWHFKLNPGTVVIFDNWRLLHGRNSYTGERHMVGCYVSRTEFQSVARLHNIIL